MKFDDIVTNILKENEEEEDTVFVKGGLSGQEFSFGKDFEVPELDEELELKEMMPGSIAVVALEVIQRSIDLVKKYDIKVPSKMEYLLFDIYTDSNTKPNFVHLTYGWDVDDDKDVVFFYIIETPKAPANVLFSPNTRKITLDQLKQIAEKETTNRAMKGHELEDLYNL
jgi:hypothetical protein